jgi:putative PIN family toxin of toxin-antitoxin system
LRVDISSGITYNTNQMPIRIVLDTNVLVGALRSRKGASFKVLSLVDSGKFTLCLSVPLVLEYEAASKKQAKATGLSTADIDSIIDYLCLVGEHFKVYYLWRPFLRDAKDDMVLELAVTSNAESIVTYNRVDFKGANQFGIKVITPKALLLQIGALP